MNLIASRSFITRCLIACACIFLSGCGNKSLTLKTIGYKELTKFSFHDAKAYADAYKAAGNIQGLRHALERVIITSPDHQVTEEALFELGTIYLFQERLYPQAQVVFGQFKKEFPGSRHILAARYNEIKAWEEALPWLHRDQTDSQTLVKLCTEYLDDTPVDAPYREEVTAILWKAMTHVLEKHLMHVDFYLTKYGYTASVAALGAAERRLADIKETLETYFHALPVSTLERALEAVQEYRTTRGFKEKADEEVSVDRLANAAEEERASREPSNPATPALPAILAEPLVYTQLPDTMLTPAQRAALVTDTLGRIRFALAPKAPPSASRTAKRLF